MSSIKFEISDWSENEKENVNHSEIMCMNDDKLAFLLRIDNENNKIMWADSYQRGHYKMTLIAALKMGFDYLVSDDRNAKSNSVYEKWLDDSFSCTSSVTITLDEENLNFTR